MGSLDDLVERIKSEAKNTNDYHGLGREVVTCLRLSLADADTLLAAFERLEDCPRCRSISESRHGMDMQRALRAIDHLRRERDDLRRERDHLRWERDDLSRAIARIRLRNGV